MTGTAHNAKEVPKKVNKVKFLRVLDASGRLVPLAIALAMLVSVSACRSSTEDPRSAAKEVIVTAPVSGTIRAVLVHEDAAVNQGAPIVEIVIQPDQVKEAAKKTVDESSERAAERSAQADLAVAELEATRAAEKVKRIDPLVARGYVSKAELDAARASHQDALARLERARDNSRVARERRDDAKAAAAPETMIPVLAPVAGKVRIIEAQPGRSVVVGQQLFALVSNT
jgi:HlyD family secretion protein